MDSGHILSRGDRWFRWTYPLAFLAAHIAFIPLFVLLLPRKLEQLSPDASLTILSWILLLSALVASVAYIAAGHWGDRWLIRFGSRRGVMAIGLAMLSVSYIWLALAASVWSMASAVIGFQIALNVLFAPLGALLTDYVPDYQKGAFAGWLNTAWPLASIVTALLILVYPSNDSAAFWVVLAVIAACCLPLLVFWPHSRPIIQRSPAQEQGHPQVATLRRDFLTIWLSRFFIQFGGAILLGYLFAYLTLYEGRDGFPATASAAIGILSLIAAGAGGIAAVGSGYLSDLSQQRLAPIAVSGLVAAIALAAIAWSGSWLVFAISYALFHLGLNAFLTVDSALVAQLLRGHAKRGMFLGFMNLTNTLPGIFGPVLTLAALGRLSDTNALKTVISLAAVLALVASLLILRVKSIR